MSYTKTELYAIKPINFPSVEMDGLDVVRYLNTLPTVDAVEVVHGRWNKNGWNDYSCSVCRHQYVGHGASGWKYCPDCGAKMDGGNPNAKT